MNEILSLLLSYHSQAAEQAEAAALLFLRIGAVMATLPAFGETVVPARIRLVLTLMFSAAVFPAVQPDLAGIALGEAFAPEVAIGLVLGLMVRLFILSLMTAGAIAANATSLSQLFPAGAEAQPAIAKLLVMAGLALALTAGLPLRVIDYLLLGYDLLPAGIWPSAALLADWGVAQIARAFAVAFMIAMPFVIASLVYNVGLGVINRAMPQLMVMFVGAPALGLGGLMLIALVAPLALSVWLQMLKTFLAAPAAPLQ
ncbi:flagellar biosynthetic protein FliR [Pseudotabrizicola algicola]|uniref:Flagellar biosynthetic protein FliR n=1 Tax=Pseudotabrizicola algicola TaxID=2709381 RepID=A0A6B3RNF2_9RHOB|nr:flagellar biosynthetic protein FliR [Pseudotabrizicola algicola]NEX46388.1 flagellar biosynthetic protein FliR [Pseudotabrizicola algicola]